MFSFHFLDRIISCDFDDYLISFRVLSLLSALREHVIFSSGDNT